MRIGVARALALVSPVVVMHALVRRDHSKYVPWLALVAAFNIEKIVYWFLALAVIEYLRGSRWMRTTALAAAPTQRMTAYAFVVIVPLGAVYLTRVMRELPRAGRWLVGALITVMAAEHYLLPASES